MSGESIQLVKVEEVTLRVLSKKENRVQAPSPEVLKKVNAIQQETKENFQQQLAKLAQRTQERQQQCKQLKSSLAVLENQSLQNLQQQQQKLRTILSETPICPPNIGQKSPEQTQPKYQQLLQAQSQQFTQLHQQQLITSQNNPQSGKQISAKIAQDLLSDVQSVISDIEQNYQHQRFTPGRLANIKRQIDLAQANLKAGLMEVVIANTQQTYLALADLRLELEQKEQEFLLLYNTGLEAVRESIVQAQAHHQYPIAVGETDEQETFVLDVNYWSNGRLSEHLETLGKLEEKLTQKSQCLTLLQVQEINQEIAHHQSQLAEIIEQARLALLNSQIRAEIADLVVSSLSDLGYTLMNPHLDAIYEGDDQRKAYVVKVKNLAGDEVVTIIKPEKEFGINSISINAYSEVLVDETAAQQNAKAVFESLAASGIQGIGEFQCKSKAKSEYRNLHEIKQRVIPQPS
jgi:hypothetical protein